MRRGLLIGCMLLAAGALRAQDLRLETLGSMRYGLNDPRASLSLYRFGQNPAGLLQDEQAAWLAFTPQITNEWGSLRRAFTPGHVTIYGAGFEGVKPLGSRGTFRGSSAYLVEERSSVYRSLKRTPYGGEAYFFTDTTTGSFTYTGPSVSFAYAYEITPELLIGADVGYALQDGLKDVYTTVKSLFRRVQGTAGLAYLIGDEVHLGLTLHPFDEQERLEAKSEEGLDAEVFNFRGETFSKRRAKSSVAHTVRLTGEEFSVQAAWITADGWQASIVGSAGAARTRDLITTDREEALEDGFAQRSWYDAAARVRLKISTETTVGVALSHHAERTWSRYTALDLLVWDARGTETVLGAGGSYLSSDGILLGGEAEYAFVHADSSKFIDNRFAIVRTGAFRVRTGVEVPISGIGTFRAGYAFGNAGMDVRSGGSDLTEHTVSAGVAVPFGSRVHVEGLVRYRHCRAATAALRDDLAVVLLLRLAEL